MFPRGTTLSPACTARSVDREGQRASGSLVEVAGGSPATLCWWADRRAACRYRPRDPWRSCACETVWGGEGKNHFLPGELEIACERE
jgi:hypothetical protein